MNSPAPTFDAEQARLAAAAHLQPAHFVEFQRLAKSLIHGPQFQLLIVDCRDERLRAKVLESLALIQQQAGLRGAELVLDDSVGDVQALESRLVALAAEHEVIHVLGASYWMDAGRWESFNLLRERLSTAVRARLVFWLNADAIGLVARIASDIWAWRSGVYIFQALNAALTTDELINQVHISAKHGSDPFDVRSMRDRYLRISEIRALLTSASALAYELKAPLLHELGDLLFSLGDFNEAIVVRNEELRMYEMAGNIREQAVTLGRIADLMQAKGNFDDALKIWRNKVLPIFENIGDDRSRVVAMGRVAVLLKEQGDVDAALRIWREVELPFFDNLGDERSKAVVLGNMADALRARGDIDEVLRIRKYEELPIYEHLGDVRSIAVVMGKIALILQDRGRFDEALEIRRKQELPRYEKIGDMHALSVGRANLAICLAERGLAKDKIEIARLLRQAHSSAVKIGSPEADKIADIFARYVGVPITGF